MLLSEFDMAHVKTECNYGKGIELRVGQDAPPTVSVAHFLNISQNYKQEMLQNFGVSMTLLCEVWISLILMECFKTQKMCCFVDN